MKTFEESEGKEIFFLHVDVMSRCNKLLDCKLIKHNKMSYAVWGNPYLYGGYKFKYDGKIHSRHPQSSLQA